MLLYLNYCAYHGVMLYYTVDLLYVYKTDTNIANTLTTTLNFVENKLDIIIIIIRDQLPVLGFI